MDEKENGLGNGDQSISEEEAQKRFDLLRDSEKALLQDSDFQKFALGHNLYLISSYPDDMDSENVQNAIDIFLSLLKGETPIQVIKKEKKQNIGHNLRNEGHIYMRRKASNHDDDLQFLHWCVQEGILTEEEFEGQKNPSTIQDGINSDYVYDFSHLYGKAAEASSDYTKEKRREGTDDEAERLKKIKEMAMQRAEEIEKELAEQETK